MINPAPASKYVVWVASGNAWYGESYTYVGTDQWTPLAGGPDVTIALADVVQLDALTP